MVCSITSLKGGTGKSTFAQNFSVYLSEYLKADVCIVDTDTNQSSSEWSGIREKDNITVVTILDPKQLTRNIANLEKKYQAVIVDGTPALSRMTSSILLVSDIVIIPIIPSALDLWASEKFIERYEQACDLKGETIPAFFALNMFDDRLNLSQDVSDAMKDYNIQTLKSTVKMRVAYREAVIEGLSVFEYKHTKALKAQKEFGKLGEEICKHIVEITLAKDSRTAKKVKL